MKYDKDKVDEMTLALLFLTSSRIKNLTRAAKSLDVATLERLQAKGYINDPKGKELSIVLTETGAALSKELFVKYFELKE